MAAPKKKPPTFKLVSRVPIGAGHEIPDQVHPRRNNDSARRGRGDRDLAAREAEGKVIGAARAHTHKRGKGNRDASD